MKYIDADRLRAEIEKHQNDVNEISQKHGGKNSFRMGRQMGIDLFRKFIDSLQQEQQEVDLEKEIAECAKSDLCPDDCTFYEFACIASHFAEWGAEHLKR